MIPRHQHWLAITAVGVCALAAAACGGETADTGATDARRPETTGSTTASSGAADTTGTATPTSADAAPFEVVDARGATITVSSTDRVIPLDGDVAEIVFALGMGDQVVATDLSATYPPEADALPQIGYQRALSTEPIVAFEPTLLIATDLAGPPETLADLERLHIPLVIVPSNATSSGPAEKIRAVAAALGMPDRGEALAAETQAAIDEAEPASELAGLRVMAVYLRGTNTQLVFGEGSGIDWVIGATGATDLGTELGVIDNAPLTAEAVLAAKPDVLLVTASGLESVGGIDGLLAIPGLAATPAGIAGNVLAYDDQVMLGNGPRTPDFLTDLTSDLLAIQRQQSE